MRLQSLSPLPVHILSLQASERRLCNLISTCAGKGFRTATQLGRFKGDSPSPSDGELSELMAPIVAEPFIANSAMGSWVVEGKYDA